MRVYIEVWQCPPPCPWTATKGTLINPIQPVTLHFFHSLYIFLAQTQDFVPGCLLCHYAPNFPTIRAKRQTEYDTLQFLMNQKGLTAPTKNAEPQEMKYTFYLDPLPQQDRCCHWRQSQVNISIIWEQRLHKPRQKTRLAENVCLSPPVLLCQTCTNPAQQRIVSMSWDTGTGTFPLKTILWGPRSFALLLESELLQSAKYSFEN